MFNKKRFQKELLAYQDAVDALLKSSSSKLAEARAIADAGERYVALTGLEAEVADTQETLAASLKGKAYDLDFVPRMLKFSGGLMTCIVMVCAAFVAAVTVSHALGVIVALGGLLVGGGGCFSGLFTTPRTDRAQEKIESMSQPFELLFADIQRSKQAVLDNELKGVATSLHFNDLYRLPEVKLAFDAAAVRALAWDEGRVKRLEGKKFNP